MRDADKSRQERIDELTQLQDITERKRTALALRESEAKFRTLANMTTASIFIYRGTRFLYVNPATETITGYPEAELLAMDFLKLVHPDLRDLVQERRVARQQGKQVPSRYELKLLTKTGQVCWVDITLGLIEFEGEMAVIGTAFDITERKQTATDLKLLLAEEREQRLLAETLGDVFLALTGQISHEAVLDEILQQLQQVVSPSAAHIMLLEEDILRVVRWHGYRPFGSEALLSTLEQPLAKFPLDHKAVQTRQPLLVPDTCQNSDWVVVPESAWIRSFIVVPICLQERVLGLLRLDSNVPNKFSRKDVEYLQPLANAAAIALENARLYEQAQQEIAERRHIEEELRRVAVRDQAMLDAIPDSLFYLNRQGRLLVYRVGDDSDSPSGTLGGRIKGTSLSDMFPPDLVEMILDYIERAFSSAATQVFEYQLPGPGGLQDFEMRLVVSGTDEVLAIVRNITERKQAERHAIRVERLAALGQLAATLAHEINNPLQAIQSHLDLILKYPLETDESEQYLQAILTHVERVRDTTQRVLNFARPQPAPRQLVAAGAVVQQVLTLTHKKLEHTGIEVFLDIQEVPQLLAAPDQLSQIFMNLVINAIEAISGHGQLTVTIYAEKPDVVVSFANSGPAIPPEVLPHIFEPFFTTKPEGSGLGLWVSHSLVQQHGGSLTVKNLTPKQGVIFTIRLPAAPPF